jgi:membrane fusion protein, heavy metal efflux system
MIRPSVLRPLFGAACIGFLSAGCSKTKAPPVADGQSGDSTIAISQQQRPQIETMPVARRSYTMPVTTTGTVNFNGDRSTSVIPAISGPVSSIMVQPGDQVRAGQPLALVSSPDFAAAVAGFRKAETTWHNSQRIATLDEKLFANDALARSELDQARSDLAAADADRQAALLQLSALGIDSASVEAIRLGQKVPGAAAAIRAPIAGVVVEKFISPGQLLQAGGSPAFTIADLSTVWVMGNVFESAIGSVIKGDPVIVTTRASSDSFVGRVDYVGAIEDAASKATPVRILVPNPLHVLKQNMLVDVTIRSARSRQGIVIPVSAVLRDDDDLPFVYLDAGSDHFNRRRITLGNRSGDEYEVTAGLAPGDLLVTRGALFLQEAGSQ